MSLIEASPAGRPGTWRRLGWLLASAALGGLVGAIGSSLTGALIWYLVVPAAMALAWWFVADPTECLPGAKPGSDATSQQGPAADGSDARNRSR